MNLQVFLDTIGFSPQKISHSNNALSTLGGLLGILGIFLSTYWLLDPAVTVAIVPSMGASAVLLFAAPHAPFSQPWNLVAGHVISAIIGVACWKWIPDLTLAASVSVSAAIGAMLFARCIHPPGGATALAAVIGPEQLHQLGFAYVYEPILLNTLSILLVAIAFNGLFSWRRYPAYLHFRQQPKVRKTEGHAPISHEDFVYALSTIDTFVDISEQDLLKIYTLATKRHLQTAESSRPQDAG